MNILFIDDNSTVQKVNIMILRKLNYITTEDTIVFKNTTNFEFPDMETSFDVIICDYDLGLNHPNGLEFFEKIEFSGLKILLTSNDSELLKKIMELQKDIKYVIKQKSFTNQISTTTDLGNYINEFKLHTTRSYK